MTQLLSAPCERCGAAVSPYALACERCGNLAHRAELERLAAEAASLEAGDPVAAVLRWRQCLQLLPPNAPQYAEIYNRIATLASTHMPGAPLPYVAPPEVPAIPEQESPGMAVLKTGGSMLLSIIVYATLFWGGGSPVPALQFATGFVALILVHELGHVAAMSYYGLRASPPIFIPFVGALINLREQPRDAKAEAVVGIGGPIAGTVGALACYAVYLQMPDSDTKTITHVLAFFGFALNLFNLIPVPPLDGGRVTAAVSPRLWALGAVGLAGLAVWALLEQQIMAFLLMTFMLTMAAPRVLLTLARRRELAADPYYAITPGARWAIGVLYAALASLLLVMWWMTRPALNAFL